jgi:guanine nucleotide-binding protein alpha-1 subunit
MFVFFVASHTFSCFIPDIGPSDFQTHFREIAKQYNPEPRAFYVHLTSVIDTKATAATLSVVEEGILRDHLRKADLL